MSKFDVGIGGQENPHNKNARENIYPLPDNRTFFIEQFTAEPPSEPELEYKCSKTEEVFAKFKPEIFASLLDEKGQTIFEQFRYKNLGDFHPAQLIKQSAFLQTLEERKEDFESFLPKLLENRVLQSILTDPQLKKAYLTVLNALIEELDEAQAG